MEYQHSQHRKMETYINAMGDVNVPEVLSKIKVKERRSKEMIQVWLTGSWMKENGGCVYLICGNNRQSKGGNLRQPKYSGVASYADLTYASSTTHDHPKCK